MILDKIFKNSEGEFINLIDILCGSKEKNNYIYTLAEAHAIDLIAKTISKCEIQTFEKKDNKIQENKGDLYWTLNLQPNYNEYGTNFIYKLVTRLLTDKRALIVINEKKSNNLLYVADEFETDNKILEGKTFSNIKISDSEGNSITLSKNYNMDNAIYFVIKNDELATASELFKENTSKILKAAQNSFEKANTQKWRLKFPGGQPTLMDLETKKPIDYSEYKKKITEGLLSEEEAIVLLSETFDLVNLNKDNDKNLTDFSNTVKQIGDAVAQKWNIPLDIFYGSKTEKSTGTNDFITFAVDPYFELLDDGFNVSLVGKKSFLKGEYIMFNRFSIQHRDIFESANGIDKLTGDGFSRNEINKFLRLPRIDEEWADQHNLTKNYANVKGGAGDEE